MPLSEPVMTYFTDEYVFLSLSGVILYEIPMQNLTMNLYFYKKHIYFCETLYTFFFYNITTMISNIRFWIWL